MNTSTIATHELRKSSNTKHNASRFSAEKDDTWSVGSCTLTSRLLVGTALYPSDDVLLSALEASGAELVTASIRRVTPQASGQDLYTLLRQTGYKLLPNTAACYTVKEAVLTAELAREALETNLIKLEVLADDETLLPDTVGLVDAATELVRKGFEVLPYTNDDPVTAQRLEDVGCSAVMPLAAPIGSGLGIRNPHNIELIRRHVSVPVIIDAGIGTASDVTLAFELGCDAVLLNTAIARAHDPVKMAAAMKHAALGGRQAALAGRIPKLFLGKPSSPTEGKVDVDA